MGRRFLYLAWLRDIWSQYLKAQPSPPRGGGAVRLPPRQYGAALLMAYLGGFSLEGLATAVGLEAAILQQWRFSPEFLLVADWAKARFADFFQENLLLEDYAPTEYEDIAGEFACLEESLRVRLRTRLYPRLRDLGEELRSRYHHGLPLETASFPRFRRLFLFFWALEAFWPSPARVRLQERLLPLAREVVWPTLGLAPEFDGLPGEQPRRWLELKAALKSEIAAVFRELAPGP